MTAPPRSGRFIAIVGPDGVGKTTLAKELLGSWIGGRAYFHFRPPLLRPLPEKPTGIGRFVAYKAPTSGSRLLGWVRIAMSFVRCWSGYVIRILPAKRKGTLVVSDRWTYGYIVEPHTLKYFGPTWLANLAIRCMPQPDLVVQLWAQPRVIMARKTELSVDQIRKEQGLLERIPAQRVMLLDATRSPSQLASEVLEAL